MLALAALPASAADRPKIAVLDLKLNTELDDKLARTLNEIMLEAFHESGVLDVIGSSDIAAMLTLEEERIKLTGCADDACLAEIGGALGVQYLAVASLGAVGESTIVSLKVLDVRRARVVDRASETVEQRDEALVKAIRKNVDKVVATIRLGMAPEAERTVPGYLPWVGLGLTVALGGTAGVLAGLASQEASEAQDAIDGTAAWRDHKDTAESRALGADVLFGVAGAAAVGTIVLFVLSRSSDDAPAASAAIAPARGGATAAVEVRW